MITCGGCGTNNELGRVFCVHCGGKLDLSAMTHQVVAEAVKKSFIAAHWPKFAIGIAALVLLVFGLTFIPTQGIAGGQGTTVAARRVESYLQSMGKLPKGRSVAYTFKDADINSYFEKGAGAQLGLGDVRVKCTPGVMRAHIVDSMFTLKLGGFVWAPGTTYDLYCTGVGGNLIVRKVKQGQLAMIGPAKSGKVKGWYKKLLEKKVLQDFQYASEIVIEEGQVRVTVSNK